MSTDHTDALRDYKALCDIWQECNALGTVLGDQDRLQSKIAKLRDEIGLRPTSSVALVYIVPMAEPRITQRPALAKLPIGVHSLYASPTVAPADELAFVMDLLWGMHPECCGAPAATDHGIYGVEYHCCGHPALSELNDKQIVAALRAKFPEPAALDQPHSGEAP